MKSKEDSDKNLELEPRLIHQHGCLLEAITKKNYDKY